MMPFGPFYTVVISVSDILPLDKGHYISANRFVHIQLLEVEHQLRPDQDSQMG